MIPQKITTLVSAVNKCIEIPPEQGECVFILPALFKGWNVYEFQNEH